MTCDGPNRLDWAIHVTGYWWRVAREVPSAPPQDAPFPLTDRDPFLPCKFEELEGSMYWHCCCPDKTIGTCAAHIDNDTPITTPGTSSLSTSSWEYKYSGIIFSFVLLYEPAV